LATKRATGKIVRATSAHTPIELKIAATGLPKKNARVPIVVAQVMRPIA
jgi:hypothetical protein